MPKARVSRQSGPEGFTLIELLVVTAIIAILAALIFAVMGPVKNSGNKAKALANIKQMLAIWSTYAAENNGRLMPTAIAGVGGEGYWMEYINRYAPGQADHGPAGRAKTREEAIRLYGIVMGPVTGPRDGNGLPWLAINYFMGPYGSGANAVPSSYTTARIGTPAKTVVFADSIWDVYNPFQWGGSGVARYDGGTTAMFGLADGHVENVVTRDKTSSNPAAVIVPKGYYYRPGQETPHQ